MAITTSKLRQDIYGILDEVLRTGVPIEIERKGRRLRIVPVETTSGKLANLKPRPYLVGDPEDLVHIDWSDQWRDDLP